ncbi:hypothetical protein GobsT_40680 [Gemmata obscuriglobus]|uniref:Uncharacterized protein n=1 Tax=Gemmata obscuriglobus TaxID=114 RepID=A0A2Z3GVY2_9BACT|nr:hypothetical protein [Gemmata obscuriglobus]AWM37883.1 hypothetical protein C1280_13340 [Gemmata obscuriglobus]QEG29274.1 hypothetical protein GobsT_40680 [Gemmata obscuriglobus]VTS08215.1 unnamed protein product [Gemmata obscuriglobus UQM 2246]
MSADIQTPPPTAGGARPIPPIAGAAEKLRAIAEKQATLGKATFEALLGAGAHLWASEEEFERFQQLVRESRGKE